MENFIYNAPPELVFGEGTEEKLPELIKKYGGTNVLVHTGGNSLEKNGYLPKIRKILNDANIVFTELSGVVPNPVLSQVLVGIDICKQKKCDFVLAIGGGSVIDSAKAIAAGFYSNDVWNDFYIKGMPVEKSLPLGAILTIPAAGSEVSASSVITNDTTMQKRSLVAPARVYCNFSIVNPSVCASVPNFHLASGIVDMLGHIIERYFSLTENTELINGMAESAMRTIIEQGRKAYQDRKDMNALAEIVLAGSIAHNNSLGIGRIQDWSSHKLEHEMSAKWNISHGAGLAIVYPAWLKFLKAHGNEKQQAVLNRFFKNVITLPKLEQFYKDLEMPKTLSNLEINATEEDINDMAEAVLFAGKTLGNFYSLSKNDIVEIYNMCK